jgi:hypothetical protein
MGHLQNQHGLKNHPRTCNLNFAHDYLYDLGGVVLCPIEISGFFFLPDTMDLTMEEIAYHLSVFFTRKNNNNCLLHKTRAITIVFNCKTNQISSL